MRLVLILVNDLFFSALGFFLGLWFWQLRSTRKGNNEQPHS